MAVDAEWTTLRKVADFCRDQAQLGQHDTGGWWLLEREFRVRSETEQVRADELGWAQQKLRQAQKGNG